MLNVGWKCMKINVDRSVWQSFNLIPTCKSSYQWEYKSLIIDKMQIVKCRIMMVHTLYGLKSLGGEIIRESSSKNDQTYP